MTGNVKQRSTFWAFVLHPPSKETLNIDISLLQPFQCLPKIQATDQNWRQGTRSASKLHTMPGRKVSWGTDVVRRFLLVPTELQKFCHRKLAGLLHAVSLFKGHLHLGWFWSGEHMHVMYLKTEDAKCVCARARVRDSQRNTRITSVQHYVPMQMMISQLNPMQRPYQDRF
jgi:hypothetical protein